jgi:hypothetical protein
MDENLQTQYDVTKRSKARVFFDKYKVIIISSVFFLLLMFGSISYYYDYKENKRVLLTESYIQAKIYLEQGSEDMALKTLKDVFFLDDPTYSSLSFFLIINENLITDEKEISSMFNHLIKNNKFSKELENLLIYKKLLHNSSYVDEVDLLKSAKPLLNSKSLWEPHALLLLGDYFVGKGEYVKAIEFYQKIFLIKNLNNRIYNHARSQLAKVSNDQ